MGGHSIAVQSRFKDAFFVASTKLSDALVCRWDMQASHILNEILQLPVALTDHLEEDFSLFSAKDSHRKLGEWQLHSLFW